MPIASRTGSKVDVAIVGAGAAGVAAGRQLQRLRPDLSVVLLESSGQVGGRAKTVPMDGLSGVPVDLGCGWLHGAPTNAWRKTAEEIGFHVDRTPAPWDEGGRRVEGDDADIQAIELGSDAYFERVEAYAGPQDTSLETLLLPDDPANARIRAVGAFITGAELRHSSVIDFNRYSPGPSPDWRVREGYGALVSAYASPLQTCLQVQVRHVDHSGGGEVRLETSKGDLAARAVLITVSSDVLAADGIVFHPALPDKIDAASHLPLGLANKLFLRVGDPELFPAESHLLGSYRRNRTGAYHFRPFGRPIIECYFAGDLALDLEHAGIDAAFDFSVEELKRVFGADVGRTLSPAVMSAWAGEPSVRGSYSYAKPGASDMRAVLAAPYEDRLFFAGEACSRTRFSTAHGAYETGVDAASMIARTLAKAG